MKKIFSALGYCLIIGLFVVMAWNSIRNYDAGYNKGFNAGVTAGQYNGTIKTQCLTEDVLAMVLNGRIIATSCANGCFEHCKGAFCKPVTT